MQKLICFDWSKIQLFMLAIEGNLVHPDLLVNRLHLPLAISNEFLLASKFLSRFGISLLLR